MKSEQWTMIGALAAMGVLVLAWRQRLLPLTSYPLGFSPFDPGTSDLQNYGPQDATNPNTAQLKQIGNNTPTYAGWGVWPFHTWGVPRTPITSPSVLPDVGIVPGQSPQHAILIAGAPVQQSPSAVPADDYESDYGTGLWLTPEQGGDPDTGLPVAPVGLRQSWKVFSRSPSDLPVDEYMLQTE